MGRYLKMTIMDLEKLINDIGIVEVDDLKEEYKIFTELMINSIEIVMLICNIEEQYGIEFSENELEFKEDLTIGEFLKKINEKMEESHASLV